MLSGLRALLGLGLLTVTGCLDLWDPWLSDRSGGTDLDAPSVDGGGPTGEAWAVGNKGTVLRREQQRWRVVSDLAIPVKDLRRVWGFTGASPEVFAVGATGTILRLRGSVWSLDMIGVTQDLTALFGLTPNQVFAGGGPALLVYNGFNWSSVSSVPITVTALFGFPTNNRVWALGPNTTHPFYIHTTGLWNQGPSLTFMGGAAVATDLWGPSATQVWAVGSGASIALFDGATWYLGNYGDAMTTQYSSVFGTSQDDVYIAGGTGAAGAGTIIHTPSGTIPFWTPQTIPPCKMLLDIHGNSASNIFAVGQQGKILHFDGTSWTEETSPTTEDLWGVWVAN